MGLKKKETFKILTDPQILNSSVSKCIYQDGHFTPKSEFECLKAAAYKTVYKIEFVFGNTDTVERLLYYQFITELLVLFKSLISIVL